MPISESFNTNCTFQDFFPINSDKSYISRGENQKYFSKIYFSEDSSSFLFEHFGQILSIESTTETGTPYLEIWKLILKNRKRNYFLLTKLETISPIKWGWFSRLTSTCIGSPLPRVSAALVNEIVILKQKRWFNMHELVDKNEKLRERPSLKNTISGKK